MPKNSKRADFIDEIQTAMAHPCLANLDGAVVNNVVRLISEAEVKTGWEPALKMRVGK